MSDEELSIFCGRPYENIIDNRPLCLNCLLQEEVMAEGGNN